MTSLALTVTAFAIAAPLAPDLPGIRQKMQGFVDAGEIAGAVTVVAGKDGILHLGALGRADLAAGTPMQEDAIFWIASMTKPITGAAVMMMADEGKLSLDDPVSKYLPELEAMKTADGKAHRITIRHLMTHTSGMPEATPEEAKGVETLAGLIPIFARKPLQFATGSRWAYCQSGINTAARIVEIVSGRSFPEFLGERLLEPLGMKDTTFYLTEAQLPRLAKSYARGEDGKLAEAPIRLLQGKQATDRHRYPAANGGLFSTAPDYARFCRMVLNGGTLDGRRYLRPESIREMTTICTGDLVTGFTPGNGWGIGWCVVREPQGITAMLSPGSCGHGGAYGTQAWLDPAKGRAYILMTQRANFPNSDGSEVRKGFQEAAVEALAK